jgi:hypothetical protein
MYPNLTRSTGDRWPERAFLRLAPVVSSPAFARKSGGDVCPLAIGIAAVVFATIIVMDVAACACLQGTAGYRQTGRLIGQEADIPQMPDGFACGGAGTHLDTVVTSARVTSCSSRCLTLLLSGYVVPPKCDSHHKKKQQKVPESFPLFLLRTRPRHTGTTVQVRPKDHSPQ